MESIDTLCGNLTRAFEEQNDDVLSLITIIDLYASEVNRAGSLKDKVKFLKTLLHELQNNKHVVQEIGWDLPKPLLKFIDLGNIDFHTRLLDNEIMATVVRCFNEIALFGNAKECFLTGCELLSELKMGNDIENENESSHEEQQGDDTEKESTADETSIEEKNSPDKSTKGEESSSSSEDSDETSSATASYVAPAIQREPEESILEVRLHLLFELINTTIKRIFTLYPSSFLATAVGAMFTFCRNNAGDLEDGFFVLKRIYLFCRGYIPPQTTLDKVTDVSEEERTTIIEDENCLQRKLLRSLLTFSLAQWLKQRRLLWVMSYYAALKKTTVPFNFNEYYKYMTDLVSRCYQLSLSFDIDIKNEFITQCVDESKRIYQSLPKEDEIVNEQAKRAISQVVYQLAYTYNLQKMVNEKNLSLDPAGVLILATQHFTETGKIIYPDMDLGSAIYMYLRFVTPAMFADDTEDYCCVTEASNFWIWVSVTTSSCSTNKEKVKAIPSYLQIAFLQLVLLSASKRVRGEERMVHFTLLTRILCLMPEEIVFEFIQDTLLSCPFEEMKCCILGILKDLMVNTRSSAAEVADNLSKLSLSEKDGSSKRPVLPPRPYILVNDDRMAVLHSLAMMSIETTKSELNPNNLRLLLTYLHFFTKLQPNWDKHLLTEINKETSKMLERHPKDEIPEFTFVKIANDNLGELLKN
ncbi:LAFE_0C07206g1_1 [Lachancea fermentati]|uniref:LAFE_0C07206g1_1 n=1 Tax=Lachancea fermentati TaxID=4955 RepID=A0A1G4M9Z2_LACFM|nr:LAFE_0C07206g1_1 [Lachancea fermentati]